MSNKLEVYHKLSTIGGSVIALECARFLIKDCDNMIAECREDLQLSCILDGDEIDMIENQVHVLEGIKQANKVIYNHYKYILN
jgi:hypothetical protein